MAAAKFVKQLVAAFSQWPIAKETVDLYIEKLAKWYLTREQWDAALDKIVTERQEGNLPTLAEIYSYLRNERQSALRPPDDGAHIYFSDYEGRPYMLCSTMVNDHGIWVYPPGHKKAGQIFHPPEGSRNFVIVPVKPAMPDPRDMPTKEEVEKLVAETKARIGSVGK